MEGMKQVVFGAFALLTAALSGCAEKYTIPPTQLAVLSAENEWKGAGGVHIQRVLHLETETGRIVEINPPVVVTITTSQGRELQFCSPLRADFDGGVLKISHSCGPPARLERMEIEKVEVEEW
jgi:hypothetical protein